ncbi:MAG: 50S ribosomal protein L21 [Candidatus Chisholmbacteria bacterium RIFCSPHIGHO2_01_FULL_48_12]|uniref:Large ribosomal subunit protein bL21 n=1 Tax=Candidatus Chisholmbacteria bacterium RIFCSPHIGHO2_01_FULL_48_12 TaxID=1797589 RepID=A0A1G1VNR7_9BACT|nr:MAG: 50S ribosomal protein L21 [Candidatus Chisholmbacteria bacterium RIFCSPHIGHO2_01_FULL_48_12]
MNYAVIGIGGKQFLVRVGDEIALDRLPAADNSSTLTFDQVYLLVNEDKVSLGTPLVSGAQVTATVLGQAKGPKIRVATYTAKSRHRRVRGHRQRLTRVKIDSIVNREKVKRDKHVKDKTGR